MKKLFKTLSAAALVSAAATTAALGLTSCTAKSTASEAPSDTAITRLAPPSDGSLPTAHTAGENLAYMAYVLDSQTQYHCYTYTVTQASIATQYTKSYKDYCDGVTISSDITYSSMVKSGSQACFVEGENGPEAYMRYSSAPSADTTNLTANWETGKPYYYDGQSYLTTYGLFQTEMTNYIINDLTITDSTPAEDNGDGTYTQSVTLDPTASTYYYQYGMKTRGGLSGFPEFQTINLDFTFDESWRVLAIDIYEVALVNKGVTVTSASTSSASYSYDEADFEEEHFAYYDSYFKSYIGSTDLSTGGGAASLDVTSVLSNGFAGVLSGGQQFEVELLLGETLYKGYIFLGLDLADPLQTLNLKLSLGKSLEDQGLYAEYSNGEIKAYYSESFGMTANLSAVKLVIDEISEWANSLELSLSSGSDGSGGLSLPEGALDELMGAMVLTHEEGSSMANLTLAADDILGLGVGINASLDFAVGEENSVAFASADISNLCYGGENINLALSLKTTSAPVISRPSSGMEADLSEYAADIFSLLNSDLVSVSLSLDGSSSSVKIDALKDIRAEVTALVDISGRAAGVAADITYYYNETPLSATVEAYYDMASGSYGKIILAVTSINGIKTDVRVHCDVAELSKALPALLKLANVQVDGLLAEEETSQSLVGIINGVLSADFSSMLTELRADSSAITITLDLDEIIPLFADINMSFGTVALTYAKGEGLSATLPALGLSLEVKGEEGSLTAPAEEGADLSDLLSVVEDVYGTIDGVIKDGALNIVVPSGGNKVIYSNGAASYSLDVSGSVSAVWQGKARVAADLNIRFNGSAQTTNLKLIYNRTTDANTPLVRLSINGAALDIYASDLNGVQSQISSYAGATDPATSTTEQGALVATVLDILSGGEWIDFLNNLTLTADGNSVALEYISDFTTDISVNTSNGLSLGIGFDYQDFAYNGRFNVVNADIYNYVDREIEKSNPSSTRDGAGLTEVIYDYIFDAFNALDLNDITLNVALNGDNSNISELSGVKVNAAVSLGKVEEDSAAKVVANVEAAGFKAGVTVTLIGETFYVDITNISDKTIPSLKLKTTADSLYDLLSEVVEFLTARGAATASAETQSATTDILYTLTNIDFGEYISLTDNGTNKVAVIDTDGLLSAFGVETGVVIGMITATLNEDLSLKATAATTKGEWLSLSTSNIHADFTVTGNYIDFSNVVSLPIADILNLIESQSLKATVSLEHAFGEHSVKATATAYVTLEGITVYADLDLEYTYQGKTISAQLSAYYEGENVYLKITSLNGKPVNMAVSCNIAETATAVENLIAALGLDLNNNSVELPSDVSTLTDSLLSLDFSTVLSGVYSNKEQGLGADINLDALTPALGLENYNLGSLRLNFANGALAANLESLGLNVILTGHNGEIPAPDTTNAFELSELVNVVTSAYNTISGIVEDGAINVELTQSAITYKETTYNVNGLVSVDWKDNTAVAVELNLSKAGSEAVTTVQLIYNRTTDANTPLVRLSINGAALDIYASDLNGVQSQISSYAGATDPATSTTEQGALIATVLDILSGGEWIDFLNNLTLTSDEGSIALGYISDITTNIFVNTTNGLSLGVEFGYQDLKLAGNLNISEENYFEVINSEIEQSNPSSTRDGAGLTEVIYDYIFDAFNALDLNDITLNVALNGDNSNISELSGVKVNAAVSLGKAEEDSAAKVVANVEVAGFKAGVTITLIGETFYVDVTNISDKTIPSLKLKTTADSLYDLLSEVVEFLTSRETTAVEEEQSGAVADILYTLTNIDFGEYISLTDNGTNKVAVIDTDGLLSAFGVETGVVIGMITATLNEDLSLNATAQTGKGEWLSLSTSNAPADFTVTGNYIDFSNVVSLPIADILNLIESQSLKATVSLGHAFGEHSVKATATAYVTLEGITVYADLALEYSYQGKTISAELSAYYEGENVYLKITSLNGKPVNMAVSCNIAETSAAVENLIASLGLDLNGNSVELPSDVSTVTDSLLSLDFSTVLSGVYSNKEQGLGADINLDCLTPALGLENYNLGSLRLNFANGALAANLESLGLNVILTGHNGEIPAIDTANAVELSELINFVNAAYSQVNGIIEDKSLAFEIAEDTPAYITVDGIRAAVYGRGEVSWKKGATAVALDLSMSIAEGEGLDEVTFKFIYNESAGADEPLVTVAINTVALEIYKEDIEGVKTTIDTLTNSLSSLLGKTQGEDGVATLSEQGSAQNDDFMYAIISLLSGADFSTVLNDMTATADGSSVMLTYLEDNFVKLSADERGIELSYGAAIENGGATFATGAVLRVSKAEGTLAGEIKELISKECTLSSSKNGESFIKLVYDTLFESIRSISVEDILGDNVYNISFDLNGKNTAVSQLKNVFVHAEAYVVNNGSGGTTMQLDLNFNIQGAVVNGSVIIENDANADNTNFYIDLTQVLNITLNGLKVKASQETLFETVEALVSILTDTNVLQTFMPAAAQSEETGSAVLSEEQAQDVSDILLSVLTSDLASNISGGTTGETTRAYVNLDGLMSAFGINVGSLGVISCEINHATHAITSSAKLGGMEEEWLSLSSQRLTPSQAQEQYAALKNLDMSDYIDIAFLPPLVNDLSATVTDENGNMYQNLTFRGEISAKVLSFLNINISDVVLTVNLDPENFYLAFEGNLSGAGVSSNTIGLTYQDNYITLRRGNEYRVMTMSYFLDKMLVSDESSSLNFLLDSGLWGVVVLGLNASGITVDSGLTTPTDYYLYSTETKKVYSEVTVADYVNAISVVLGGQNVLDYKSDTNVSTTLSNLGLSGDYYAFDLNARLLTDNVLTALSAAIMRNSDGSGVTGIKAYGAIQSYVTFNLNLGYSEANNSAPLSSHYEAVEEGFKAALAADTGIDDNTIFGCYNSGDGSVEHQTLLTAYTFNVKDPDGTITTHTVRDGSTVHLYDNYNPEYSDDSETKRVVYYLNGNLCSSFVMSAEMNGVTVQKAYAEAVDLTVHNPEGFAGDFTYHTFIGDKLPESFEGYILTSGEYTLNGTPVAQITELGKDHIAGGTQIIGSFAYSSRTVNNIIYSYDVSRGGFAVTGTAAGFQQYYIYENRTVVLENQIDGIPVVAIGASAFQNTSYDSDGNIDPTKSIKNIVVPANITYVGESAFKDNVGMQSAVFLAESVTFAGSGTDGDSTYPFYGCSTYATDGEVNGAKGNEQTVLNVYVNSVTNSNDDWKLFRYVLQVIVPYRFYIGDDGGSVVSSGWQYSSVAVENSTEYDIESEVQTYVKDGLNTTVYENTAIVSALQEVVDGYTAEKYNAIGYYVVSVTSSKDSFGVMQYTVNLLPAQANEIYYVVSVNNGACGGVDLTGDVRTFNGNTYARGAVTFTAKDINAGYEFTSFTANGISYFTNPATIEITSPTEIVTVCEANIVNVTIVSRVSFTYAGVTYEPGTASVPVALDENDNLSAVTPVSAGYTFLGWAAADAEGALTFSTLSDPASTYYTIWAVAKEGITYSGLGNTVSASFTGGTLYGWYADADYTREISNEISTENTIFNIRRQYSLTYGISGSGTQYQDTATMSGNSYALSASKTATIYEGQIVEIARTNDKHDITITIDRVNYTTLKLIKFQIIFNIHYTFKDDYFSNGESFSFVASQDASYTFKY